MNNQYQRKIIDIKFVVSISRDDEGFMWRYGRTIGCGATEGYFLVKSLWIKLWNSAKRKCRNPGLVALRLFGSGVMQPGQRELPLRSE
jgi:hypothetical protein